MIKISVSGKPAPQGNHRTNQYGATYETSKGAAPWREAVRAETQRTMRETGADQLAGPVRCEITFWLVRPKGHYRTGRNAHLVRDTAPRYPGVKPDPDKLARAVLDGLTSGHAYRDDGQVVDLIVHKRYAERPGADIELSEVD